MIPAILDFDNYRSYEGETVPTTYAQMQTYMSNQNKIIKAIVATHLWQPATTYIVGQVVHSDSMTLNTCARCIVAGTSAENDEPTWGTVIGAQISGDGGVTWEIIATSATTNATKDGVGNVIDTFYAPLDSPALTGTPTAPTTETTDNTTKLATTAFVVAKITAIISTVAQARAGTDDSTIMTPLKVKNAILLAVPVGTLIDYAGSTVPDGYLVCNGSAISRTTYSALFAVIGTTYGTGDGSTTFTLPNLINRVKQGSSTVGTYKSAGLPNITGGPSYMAYAYTGWTQGYNGALGLTIDSGSNSTGAGSAQAGAKISFDASRSNSIYGASTTVQPPALTVLPCIKY